MRPAASPRQRQRPLPPLRAHVGENTHYYLLGYQSSDARRDGRFRKVDVHISAPCQDSCAWPLYAQAETLAYVKRHGFRTLSRLELAPGRYQVRVAALEQNSKRGGSVVHDLLVPDYSAQPIALSHLLLASRGAAQAITTRPDPELKDRLPLPSTAVRQFDQPDVLTVFAEVYDNRGKGIEPLALVTTVSDVAGKAAFRSKETVEASSFDPSRKSWTHRLEIPLKDLTSGTYTLRLGAKPRGAANAVVAREVAFSVVPAGEMTLNH